METEAVEELAVRCLLLPLRGIKLLVPNTTIAEISGYIQPEMIPHAPEWLQGMVLWRGSSIPLLSYESLLGEQSATPSPHRRIAIFNSLRGNPAVPFFAMETAGIPRLLQVKDGMLQQETEEFEGQAMVLRSVTLGGDRVIIPALDAVEKMLSQLGLKAH